MFLRNTLKKSILEFSPQLYGHASFHVGNVGSVGSVGRMGERRRALSLPSVCRISQRCSSPSRFAVGSSGQGPSALFDVKTATATTRAQPRLSRGATIARIVTSFASKTSLTREPISTARVLLRSVQFSGPCFDVPGASASRRPSP